MAYLEFAPVLCPSIVMLPQGRAGSARIARVRRTFPPRPSIAEPRPYLLEAVRRFVREARACPGVSRIALLGSLATPKPIPKDADVLVTIEPIDDLAPLARVGRRLMGTAQRINLGADVFLADPEGRYIGRICYYRECWPRRACFARSCGLRQHLNDDLQRVTLSREQVSSPPCELWPKVVRRTPLPEDVERLLLSRLETQANAPD